MEKTESVQKLNICLALGFFDCVHVGHAKILERCVELAKESDAIPAAFTFLNDPKKNGTNELYSFSVRKEIFAECGIEKVIAYSFSEKTKNTEPLVFLSELCDGYSIKAFVCGRDYRFGYGGLGDVSTLSEFCKSKGIRLSVVDDCVVDGVRVSSSEIKRLIDVGDIESANKMLGRRYSVTGTVVPGRGVGRVFGIPTTNLSVGSMTLLPYDGVYATVSVIDGVEYKSVTNVGDKPTFRDYTTTVESLIGDGFCGEIYGKEVKLYFVYRMRDVMCFDSPVELAKQVKDDLKEWEKSC